MAPSKRKWLFSTKLLFLAMTQIFYHFVLVNVYRMTSAAEAYDLSLSSFLTSIMEHPEANNTVIVVRAVSVGANATLFFDFFDTLKFVLANFFL